MSGLLIIAVGMITALIFIIMAFVLIQQPLHKKRKRGQRPLSQKQVQIRRKTIERIIAVILNNSN